MDGTTGDRSWDYSYEEGRFLSCRVYVFSIIGPDPVSADDDADSRFELYAYCAVGWMRMAAYCHASVGFGRHLIHLIAFVG